MVIISSKIDIKTLSRQQLCDWLAARGIRPFRANQIWQWIYTRQTDRFDEMTNLGKALRADLETEFINPRLEVENEALSQDGSRKLLFRLADGQHIETVLIPEKDHYTLCVSSQVGCAQGCRFCMTAKGGFVRHLSAAEIISQVRDLQKRVDRQGEMPLSNIVVMGMGEPLANYDNLVQALDVITDGDFGLKFSTRRVTVSTAGLVSKLPDLGRDTRVNLAVSLNATDDETRSRLMPINRRFPLTDLITACRNYPLPPRRKITFEYILMKGVNDSLEDARRLVKLLRPVKAKINLIPFNEHPGSDFRRPSPSQISAFQELLADHHYTVIVRHSKGQDIGAACGQLRAKLIN
ncbi:dual-specificity RNA methyltransferase RlmN [Desulfosarcina ovata subsp. sediminis]|uniref:Probable dual-specificity RNA methyltransferase RlmN n=1 Tax=Desulfosarcina ovata subsp. sediminis TaxID=885957 RepID=A0A5K7ZQK4_9BACT|nr:23S rRNA (adenine(2503)-C(2))-methyltransferase RlmN [Desulfosarcina ovata]BBO81990.1 dual-specificity RNA methyltransferase RlmN [Desulfosarcina ovata subsp. sediminis]